MISARFRESIPLLIWHTRRRTAITSHCPIEEKIYNTGRDVLLQNGCMETKVKPIPEGHHTVTPYIVVQGVAKLIDFAKQAFGATEVFVSKRPDGSIMHAEIKIGDSIIMMGEGGEGKTFLAMLHLFVDDVDAVYLRSIQAGGKSLREPADQVYGDRTGAVEDSFGNQWWLATHMEDVTPEEIERRAKAAQG
jgi:PhnB protein